MESPNQQPLQLSVVIVNYNGERFLPDCISSLQKALSGVSSEIIVVDNQSVDNSCTLLERDFADVRLIRSPQNLGFTGGNNLGANYARGELLLLLNNDTRCLTSLQPLLLTLLDQNVGVAGCHLQYASGDLQYSVGFEHSPARIVLSWLGLAKLERFSNQLRRMETRPGFYAEPQSGVAWVSGACLLTRTELWQRLGGFDDRYFMYCEDVDYCRRVRKSGLNIVYTPACTVLHYEGAGKIWIGEKALLRTSRSYLIYLDKHFGALSRVLVGILLGGVFAVRALAYVMQMAKPDQRALAQDKGRAYWRAACLLMVRAIGFRPLETKI